MAYALGPTRPDHRQTRIFARRRGRRAPLLIALALFGLAGGAVAVYRLTASPLVPAVGEVPLIRADSEPTRKRPDTPGGMEVAGQGTLALDGGRGAPTVEHLLPAPETPLPPPAPPPAAPAVVAPEPSPTIAAPVLPSPPPAAPVVAAPPAPVAPPAKPATIAVAPAPAHPMPPAAKGYRLQLGAVRDAAAAKLAWERMRRRHPDLLGRLGFAVERVDLGERGIFYRLQAGPLADGARAERECQELKRRGVSCLLVRP